MKRRDVLISAATLAGAVLPRIGRTQNVPCPPPALSIEGGTSASSACAPSNAPAWFAAMADRTWVEVAAGGGRTDLPAAHRGRRIVDELPSVYGFPMPGGNPINIPKAWTGGTANQEQGELLFCANGGHGAYNGNECYACELRTETPRWRLLSQPTPSTYQDAQPADNTKLDYADGRMRAGHNYGKPQYANGRIWWASSDGESIAWSTNVWAFNRASLVGRTTPLPHENNAGPFEYYGIARPNVAGGSVESYVASPCAYDGYNQRVWAVPQFSVASPPHPFFSVSTATATLGQITQYPSVGQSLPGSPFLDAWGCAAHDLGFVFFGSASNGQLFALDVTGNISSSRTEGFLKPPVSGSPSGFVSGAGAVYHKPSRAILVWHHSFGSNIRKLSIPSNPRTGTYTWSQVSAAAGTPASPPGSIDADCQGVYNKFNIIHDMGDGQSALVTCNNINGSTFVYKLPAQGV